MPSRPVAELTQNDANKVGLREPRFKIVGQVERVHAGENEGGRGDDMCVVTITAESDSAKEDLTRRGWFRLCRKCLFQLRQSPLGRHERECQGTWMSANRDAFMDTLP